MANSIQIVVTVLQALSTPVIAAIAVYIAWQQWKLSHDKVALDLYDRRYKAYENLRETLGIIMRSGTATDEEMLNFVRKASESDFLFERDVLDYHEKFYKNGIRLSYLRKVYDRGIRGEVPNYDNNKVVDEEAALIEWFSAQYGESKKLYGTYLKIGRRSSVPK